MGQECLFSLFIDAPISNSSWDKTHLLKKKDLQLYWTEHVSNFGGICLLSLPTIKIPIHLLFTDITFCMKILIKEILQYALCGNSVGLSLFSAYTLRSSHIFLSSLMETLTESFFLLILSLPSDSSGIHPIRTCPRVHASSPVG